MTNNKSGMATTTKNKKTKQKKKEGRARKSSSQMATEAGRYIFRDLIHWDDKKNGVNPFILEDVESVKFWKSRNEYQEVPHGAFLQQARILAPLVISQMPPERRKEAEAAAKKKTAKTTAKTIPIVSVPTKSKSPKRTCDKSKKSSIQKCIETKKKSLRDTYVAPLPGNKSVLVVFEPDGDICDPASNRLEFKEGGTKLLRWSKVPAEWTNVRKLIGSKTTKLHMDGDCMLLSQEIAERHKSGAGPIEDENGVLWEPREVIELPFPCHKALFNKHSEEIPSFLLQSNQHKHAWCYFWLRSRDVPFNQKNGPSRIGGVEETHEDEDSESEDGSIVHPGGMEIAFDERHDNMTVDEDDKDDQKKQDDCFHNSPFNSLQKQTDQQREIVAEILPLRAEVTSLRQELELKVLKLENANNDLIDMAMRHRQAERRIEMQNKL